MILVTEAASGAILDANLAAADFYGYTLDRLRIMNIADLCTVPAGECTALHSHPAHAELKHYTCTHQLANGARREIEVYASPIELSGRREIVSILHDVSEPKRMMKMLHIQRDLGQLLGAMSDLSAALSLVLEAVCRIEGIDCGGVYLVDGASGALDLVVHRGLAQEFTARATHYASDSLNARIVRTGQPRYGCYAELRYDRDPALLQEGLRALAIIPICHAGDAIAVLNLGSHTHDEVPTDTRLALEAIAAQIGGALARLRAQAALKESQENLQALFDTIDDCLFILAADGRIVQTNAAVCTRLGYTADELTQLTVLDMHPPARRGEAAAIVADMLAGRVEVCQVPLMTKQGALIPVETRVTHGRWSGQDVLIGITRDITARVRAEAALRDSEARFRSVTQCANDAVVVADHEGTICLWNPGAQRIFGYTEQEILGQPFNVLLPTSYRASHSACLAQEAAAGLFSIMGKVTELPGWRKDGQEFPLELSLSAWPTDTGSAYVAIIRDITARVQAAAALRESEARYRTLAEAAHDLIFIVDREGRVEYVNRFAAAQYGRLPAELIGRRHAELFPVEVAAAQWRSLSQVFSTGQPLHAEAVADLAGAKRWLSTWLVPIREGDAVRAVLGVSRDIEARKHMEQELQSQRDFAQQVMTAMGQGLTVTNSQGCFEFVNPAYARLVGRPAAELIGLRPADLTVAEDHAVLAQARADRKAGKTTTYETRLQRPDGALVPVLITSAPRWDGQQVVGAIAVFTDLTERKQAEAALRRSEEQLREAQHLARLGSWEWDLQTQAVMWSDEVYRIFGVTPGEFAPAVAAFEAFIHPDDRDDFLRRRAELLAETHTAVIDHRIIRRDGAVRHVQERAQVLLDGADQACRVTGTVQDITSRKEAEQIVLRRAEELAALQATVLEISAPHELPVLLQMVVEQAVGLLHARSGGLYFCDPVRQEARCVVSYRTPHDYTGTILKYGEGAAGTVAQSGAPLIIDDYRVWARRAAVYDAEQPFTTVLSVPLMWQHEVTGVLHVLDDVAGRRFTPSDLALLTLFASHAAIAVENMRLHEAAQNEIAERKQAEERLAKTARELARSNAELEQFAYVISHDLQQPLRTVAGFTHLLDEQLAGQLDTDAREFMGFIVDGARRMQQLINDLLEYARVGSRGQPFHPTDAAAALNDAVWDLRPDMEDTEATITCDALPTVLADVTQLTELFQNLVGNAIKYRGAAPPQIHIGVQREGQCWRFSVRDNGIGIDPQHFDRIFGIFQRLHTNEEYPGTGIGLAVCQRIVERHGGRLWVESQPGQGSTFYFTLPM